jgi:hypothetical protein
VAVAQGCIATTYKARASAGGIPGLKCRIGETFYVNPVDLAIDPALKGGGKFRALAAKVEIHYSFTAGGGAVTLAGGFLAQALGEPDQLLHVLCGNDAWISTIRDHVLSFCLPRSQATLHVFKGCVLLHVFNLQSPFPVVGSTSELFVGATPSEYVTIPAGLRLDVMMPGRAKEWSATFR